MADRRCLVCGSSLAGHRADAEVCGSACRRERSRLRALAAGKRDAGYQSLDEYTARRRRPSYLRVGMHPPTYNTWRSMIARCEVPGNAGFGNYGARGVTVCPRWRDSFEAFIADMGERPEGMTLDRIDPEGNYESSNCRWATLAVQAANRRRLAA